jgi:GDPmannose 4,6-dehydratase
VTRKITRAAAKISLGLQETLYIGNMDAKRDWGHAKDYVEAMWLMLQQDLAEDFVIATGETTSVRDFIKMSFEETGITLRFEGKEHSETGIVESVIGEASDHVKPGDTIVLVDPRYFRPTEVDILVGDPSKAREKLGWEPKYDIKYLVRDMVNSDLGYFRKQRTLLDNGHTILKQAE